MIELRNGAKIGKTDLLMLMTVLFWAVNLSVIKIGLRELTPHAFNAIRLTIASLVYLGLLAFGRGKPALAKGDGWKAVGLGILGITAYQLFFIQAISRTNASTASVVMATSPIFIALLSTAMGQERVHWAGWIGILISFAGFFLVIASANGGSVFNGNGMRGAVLIILANICWAAYTVFSKPVLERNSPVRLAAVGTAAGTFLYLPFTVKEVAAVEWHKISWAGWGAVLYSGLIAIVLCFIIWYYSLREVGSSKTGIYSNLTPIFAVAFAGLSLGEHFSRSEAVGSAVVLAGVYLTRSGYRFFERRAAP
ncbi:MAG: DMT family transporter [Candidatus Aminicenantales bacterium]|jgi:drug/metabolite transporter (DMT)-like permease